jgi:Putative Flp pilus-assembly TadE/G-like
MNGQKRSSSGQAYVLTILFLVVLLGMAAAVLDVGSWYRAQRALQATVDAAALAGAQELPYDTGLARSKALEYAGKNGGGVSAANVVFSSKFVANDTIKVTGSRPAPGFFAKVFGVEAVTVGAHATARTANISSAQGVAPITVHYKHPLLNCTGGSGNPTCNPTFNTPTTLQLEDLHQPGGGSGSGAFGLINLNQNDSTGTASAPTLSDWLLNGSKDYLDLGKYYSAPSANFNNSQFIDSMTAMLGKELLFPVYRLLTGPGSNSQYDVIGWVGFTVTSFNPNGTPATITGYFTRYLASGIQVNSGGAPSFGARAVQLVE